MRVQAEFPEVWSIATREFCIWDDRRLNLGAMMMSTLQIRPFPFKPQSKEMDVWQRK
jgi:hypothetical protein